MPIDIVFYAVFTRRFLIAATIVFAASLVEISAFQLPDTLAVFGIPIATVSEVPRVDASVISGGCITNGFGQK